MADDPLAPVSATLEVIENWLVPRLSGQARGR
jgi:hypothetical protein